MLDEWPGLCVAVGLVDGLLELVYSVGERIVSTNPSGASIRGPPESYSFLRLLYAI